MATSKCIIHHGTVVPDPLNPKPIIGILPGAKYRVRFRPDAFPQIFIRTPEGIFRYLLVDEGAIGNLKS